MPRPHAAAVALLGPLWLAACAESPPPPAAAPEAAPPAATFQPGSREYSPLDQEMLAIGRAEEELDRLFPEQRAPTSPRKAGKAGPPPDEPPARPQAKDTGNAGQAHAPPPMAGGTTPVPAADSCAVACKALNSMASSAEKLCHLSGENDGRCDDARSRVRGASARVKAACPGCTVSAAPAAAPKGTPGPDPKPSGPAPGMPGSSIPIP